MRTDLMTTLDISDLNVQSLLQGVVSKCNSPDRDETLRKCGVIVQVLRGTLKKLDQIASRNVNTEYAHLTLPYGSNLVNHVVEFSAYDRKMKRVVDYVSEVTGFSMTSENFTLRKPHSKHVSNDRVAYSGWRKLRKYHEDGHLSILDPSTGIFVNTKVNEVDADGCKPNLNYSLPVIDRLAAVDDRDSG